MARSSGRRIAPLFVVALVAVGCGAVACTLLVDTADLDVLPTTSNIPDAATNDDPRVTADAAPADVGTPFSLGCDAPNLVAAWRFDEASGTTASDCTGHGFDGKLGGIAAWATGRDGGAALSLSANAWAECAKPAELRFAGSLSIAAWVLLRSLTNDFGRIFASSLFSDDVGFELTYEIGDANKQHYWSFIMGTTTSDGGTAVVLVDSRGGVSADVWIHVAAVYDVAGSISLYVDGALEDTKVVQSPRRLANQPFYIGRRSECCFFHGSIDDLRVYSRALPAAEVLALAGR